MSITSNDVRRCYTVIRPMIGQLVCVQSLDGITSILESNIDALAELSMIIARLSCQSKGTFEDAKEYCAYSLEVLRELFMKIGDPVVVLAGIRVYARMFEAVYADVLENEEAMGDLLVLVNNVRGILSLCLNF